MVPILPEAVRGGESKLRDYGVSSKRSRESKKSDLDRDDSDANSWEGCDNPEAGNSMLVKPASGDTDASINNTTTDLDDGESSPKIDWAAHEATVARIEVMFAERKRWVEENFTNGGCWLPPPKTQEQEDADVAAEWASLIEDTRVSAQYGLGASILEDGLSGVGTRKKNQVNDPLRRVLLGNNKGLQASKRRDVEEKVASLKRGLEVESSDEEAGRSTLGKAKKNRIDPPKSSASRTNITTADAESKIPVVIDLSDPEKDPGTITAAEKKRRKKAKKKEISKLQKELALRQATSSITPQSIPSKLKDRLLNADNSTTDA